ncbi:hypothetical protein RFI_22876 [Reticulomyxa filosa]|uniref:Uncharacterized protein n=1 Tax=Reticulomyxa filosa TaxID=46433 RepID=X6MKX2_RETFI|nr:hypothetical protein RFI_22876 [Reticulomyxa filosa]|eukprot:ETO14489.1 hypothetical protein RFI_22876 [Reticulomyxa filosa]
MQIVLEMLKEIVLIDISNYELQWQALTKILYKVNFKKWKILSFLTAFSFKLFSKKQTSKTVEGHDIRYYKSGAKCSMHINPGSYVDVNISLLHDQGKIKFGEKYKLREKLLIDMFGKDIGCIVNSYLQKLDDLDIEK